MALSFLLSEALRPLWKVRKAFWWSLPLGTDRNHECICDRGLVKEVEGSFATMLKKVASKILPNISPTSTSSDACCGVTVSVGSDVAARFFGAGRGWARAGALWAEAGVPLRALLAWGLVEDGANPLIRRDEDLPELHDLLWLYWSRNTTSLDVCTWVREMGQ